MADGSTRNQIEWLERACIIVPAYDAGRTLASVVVGLREEIPELAESIIVVDDGSNDDTRAVAESLHCIVITHPQNRGKGSALLRGLAEARARGFEVALTVDADGQHPPEDARRVLLATPDPHLMVLGVRDLEGAGAPKANQVSNRISNYFLSKFAGQPLHDTQCGLRRYNVKRTLSLGARGKGYDFEAEILLRAIFAGGHVLEEPVAVRYPADRTTHFRVARDPWRIIRTVVSACVTRRR